MSIPGLQNQRIFSFLDYDDLTWEWASNPLKQAIFYPASNVNLSATHLDGTFLLVRWS
jgi:hypothetical protein